MSEKQTDELASAIRDLSRSVLLVGFLILLGLTGVQCQMMSMADKLEPQRSIHVTTHEGR